MSTPFVLAVPSKGRLQENAEAFFMRAGLSLAKPRGARDYRGTIPGLDKSSREDARSYLDEFFSSIKTTKGVRKLFVECADKTTM